MEIDFVIPWVDGDDPAWQSEKSKYSTADRHADAAAAVERFRDWGLLRYWFRGVEKYAPWVRKIHFVTSGKIPEWLDTSNEKIHIVRHEDFIPGEALPTFNCNVIERYLHKIPGLSEHFVYFNDDLFLISEIKEADLFANGKPRDMLAFQPVVANPENALMSHFMLNDTLVLSKYFNKRENVKAHPGNYFHIGYPPLYFFYNILELFFPLYSGLYTVHSISPFLKSTFEEVWKKEGKMLASLDGNRFRSESDVNQYLFREWQKLSGNFAPANVRKNFKYFEIKDDNSAAVKLIENGGKRGLPHRISVVCLNDTDKMTDVNAAKRNLAGAFEKLLPEPSAFEKLSLS